MEDLKFRQIGIIHTPLTQKEQTPIQSARSDVPGTVEIFPEYCEGLEGIGEFSHLILLYHLDRSEPCSSLLVKPFLDDRLHGVFATRYPCRPNPIGLSVVRLVECNGAYLNFIGADMLDGTPLLDVKPYIPEFDIHEVTKIGWYGKRAFS